MDQVIDHHAQNKAALAPFCAALYDFDKQAAREAAAGLFVPGAPVHLSHPFNALTGQSAFLEAAILPLALCFPDLERRDQIILAGESQPGQHWVGCAGHYVGTFRKPWLSIPATGHIAAIRYHEFYRFDHGQVVEVQALWDIAGLMMQAGCWPMAPSLGHEWLVPGPAGNRGLDLAGPGLEARAVVEAMRARADHGGADAAGTDEGWHPRLNWYGPAGIGTGRGLDGMQRWHRQPFLNALPGRAEPEHRGHLISQGEFVGFTGWPGRSTKLVGDGWLGIAPSGQEISLRALEFWRVEAGRIRENWVLMDLLHVYHQLGVDVLSRMQDLTGQKALG